MQTWLQIGDDIDVRSLSPLTLAYVGDAVFELYVRTQLAGQGGRIQQMHQAAVRYVNAEAQREILYSWEPHLDEEELAVVRRGRNAKGTVPRNADTIAYRKSTGLEALVGFLFLTGRSERLGWLLQLVQPTND